MDNAGTLILAEDTAIQMRVPCGLRPLVGQNQTFASRTARSGLLDQLPDSGEVMVIVLRDEVQMIDQAHGLLKARMQHGARVKSWIKLRQAIDQA